MTARNPPPRRQHAFAAALDVMLSLYASVAGTAVLQCKRNPPRPARFDGCLILFDGLRQGGGLTLSDDLRQGEGEAALCAELTRLGRGDADDAAAAPACYDAAGCDDAGCEEAAAADAAAGA
eukprot:439982-Prymnesium_polylepis.3